MSHWGFLRKFKIYQIISKHAYTADKVQSKNVPSSNHIVFRLNCLDSLGNDFFKEKSKEK